MKRCCSLITAGRDHNGFEGLSKGLKELLHGPLPLAEQRTRLHFQHNPVSGRWYQGYQSYMLRLLSSGSSSMVLFLAQRHAYVCLACSVLDLSDP
jgi:hypothetical protein